MAKGEEYNKDSHDAEAILAHYRVDKTIQTVLLAVATLGNSSNELTSTSTTISCRLPFLSFRSFFLQYHQVWGLGESKEPSATAFHASLLTAVYTAANGHSCAFAIRK